MTADTRECARLRTPDGAGNADRLAILVRQFTRIGTIVQFGIGMGIEIGLGHDGAVDAEAWQKNMSLGPKHDRQRKKMVRNGTPGGGRTRDHSIKSRMLYH